MTLFFILALYTLLVFVWFICFAFLLLMTYGLFTTRAPYVPIPQYVVDEVTKVLPLRAGDTFYDLGSGDGRVIAGMGAAYPQASAIGVEKSPLPYLLTQFRFWRMRVKNARTLFKSFFDVPLHDATHIFVYLFPEVMEKLLPKFEAELKSGTRVVSCDFPFKNKEPVETRLAGTGKRKHTLYVYEF